MLVLVGGRVLLNNSSECEWCVLRLCELYIASAALSHLPFATSFKGMRDNGGAIRFAGAARSWVCA